MASLKSIRITVGEQITVEQLIEKCKVMMIYKAIIMQYRHHVRQVDRLLLASTTITPHIDRLLPAPRVLSSREQSNALSKMT